jgi:hypothetical protein
MHTIRTKHEQEQMPAGHPRRRGGKRRSDMGIEGPKVRLSLQVSPELNQTLEDIAESTGSNLTDIVRQALALMMVAHTAKKEGRHLGIVSDARKLDTEIVGLI